MENATGIDSDLLEVTQTAILDYIYMDHHSTLHPFHHNFIDKSQRHWQLQNISQYEQRILLPCDEKLVSAKEQVTYQHNRQSEAEGCHSEKNRNLIKKDLKETVGSVRRPLTNFSRKESFSQSEKKLHTCEICNRSFSEKGNLTKHMILHSDVKPYVCKICDASFKHRSTLVYHDRIHTGEQPFSCQKCNRKFSHNSNMRVHERTCRNDE